MSRVLMQSFGAISASGRRPKVLDTKVVVRSSCSKLWDEKHTRKIRGSKDRQEWLACLELVEAPFNCRTACLQGMEHSQKFTTVSNIGLDLCAPGRSSECHASRTLHHDNHGHIAPHECEKRSAPKGQLPITITRGEWSLEGESYCYHVLYGKRAC